MALLNPVYIWSGFNQHSFVLVRSLIGVFSPGLALFNHRRPFAAWNRVRNQHCKVPMDLRGDWTAEHGERIHGCDGNELVVVIRHCFDSLRWREETVTLKAESCHDTNIVVLDQTARLPRWNRPAKAGLLVSRFLVVTACGVPSDDKVGIMTALSFHCWFRTSVRGNSTSCWYYNIFFQNSMLLCECTQPIVTSSLIGLTHTQSYPRKLLFICSNTYSSHWC